MCGGGCRRLPQLRLQLRVVRVQLTYVMTSVLVMWRGEGAAWRAVLRQGAGWWARACSPGVLNVETCDRKVHTGHVYTVLWQLETRQGCKRRAGGWFRGHAFGPW